MERPLDPNEFNLVSEDGHISIHYEAFGVVRPQLTYHDRNDSQGKRTFGPKDIEVVSTKLIGTIVTVTLDLAFDGDMRNLNLLLPEVRQNSGTESVHTIAILTINRGSIAPQSLEGQIQLYQVFELNGTSRRVGKDAGSGPPGVLFQRWVRSHEEDTGDFEVYRPQGFELPPARGRQQLEFSQDGTLTLFEIGPGDGLRPIQGEWIAATGSQLNITLENGDKSTLIIDTAADDILKVRRPVAGTDVAP